MSIARLIAGLGGQQRIAAELGLGKSAVGMWVVRDGVPREHHLAVWAMALAAGVAWEPPGGAAIRAHLGGPVPAGCPAAPRSGKVTP